MSTAATVPVRVWVPDVWDAVTLELQPGETVADLKSRALHQATGRRPDPSLFQVKYRGGLVLDERQTLGELAAPARAPFVIVPLRRRPVR